jgi:hypothetical protein
MTNAEARHILIDYNVWRCGGGKPLQPTDITCAIDSAIIALGDSENLDLSITYLDGYAKGKRSKPPIAQAIRDAAMDWNCDSFDKLYGSVELKLVASFYEGTALHDKLLGWHGAACRRQARTFMLFVAEALES